MFIIVTGVIGVGKSTVCRKLIQIIQSNGLVCDGILTFKSAEGGIIIEDIRSGKKAPLAEINDGASDGPRTARYLFNQSGINFGIQALHEAASTDVLIVDEIGQLELRGEGLVPALDIIKSGRFKNCVLVVRKALLPFYLPQFSISPRVFETTMENRNELPQQISSTLLEEVD
ncbi:nucleoside-triphosphatase [Chloroflexota bacterium]